MQEYRPEPEPRRVEQQPRAEAPRVDPTETPRVDPRELLESDGLVMIETDRSKAPTPAPQAEEAQHVGRPRRERPKAPAPQEDELVQIETSRK